MRRCIFCWWRGGSGRIWNGKEGEEKGGKEERGGNIVLSVYEEGVETRGVMWCHMGWKDTRGMVWMEGYTCT